MLEITAYDVFTELRNYQRGSLDCVTSFLQPGCWFAQSYKRGVWDGKVRFIAWNKELQCYVVPTGFLRRILDRLDRTGEQYTLYDERQIAPVERCELTLHDSAYGKISLQTPPYEFQGEALRAVLLQGRGIVHAATGAGKTEIGAAAISSIDKETVWFTHRTSLLHQTRARLAERLQQKVGIIGDGLCEYQDVTVAMVQSCSRKDHGDFLASRQVVIGDECHHIAGAGTEWYSNFAACPAPYRIGLSATPQLTGPGLRLLAMTGNVIYHISTQELIQRGVAVIPRIWIVQVNQKLSAKSWQEAYKLGVVENDERNNAIVACAQQFASEQKNILILVSRVNHAELLQEKLAYGGVFAEVIRGSVASVERDRILQRMWEGKTKAVVAICSTMGEGVNLPRLKAIINATGMKGGGDKSDGETGRDTIQILGRGLRRSPGKDYVDYVDFFDLGHRYLKNATKDRFGTLKEEGYADCIKPWTEYVENGNSPVVVGGAPENADSGGEIRACEAEGDEAQAAALQGIF